MMRFTLLAGVVGGSRVTDNTQLLAIQAVEIQKHGSGSVEAGDLNAVAGAVKAMVRAPVSAESRDMLQNIKESLLGDNETSIFSGLKASKVRQEGDHQGYVNDFAKINTDYTTRQGHIAQRAQQLAASQSTHEACRVIEGQNKLALDTCDGEEAQGLIELGSARSAIRNANPFVCEDGTPTTDDASVNDINAHIAAAGTWSTKKDYHVNKVVECNGLRSIHGSKKEECGTAQHVQEERACQYAAEVQGSWKTYETEFSSTMNAFSVYARPVWVQDSLERKQQCELLFHIGCYIDIVGNPSFSSLDVEAEIEACSQTEPECSSVVFEPPSAPTMRQKDATPAAPCSAAYNYGSFPDPVSPVEACMSSCVTNSEQEPIFSKYMAGDTVYNVAFWNNECASWPSDVNAIRVTVHGWTDFFKPKEGSSLCDMMTSSSNHQWSADGASWVQPSVVNGHLGGGYEPNGGRTFINQWGSPTSSGGCCSERKDGAGMWNMPFVIEGLTL